MKNKQNISIDYFEAIVNAIDDGIVLQNSSGEIVAFNNRATEILGISPDQLTGKTSYDLDWHAIKEDGSPFPGEEHPAIVTLKTGVPQKNIVMGVHKKNGLYTWLSINTKSLNFGGEKYVFGAFYDITEQFITTRELNQTKSNLELIVYELESKMKQLEELNKIIAHNLRGPVKNIHSLLNMYRHETNEKTKEECFQIIQSASTTLVQTLDELLEIVQIHLNKDLPNEVCLFQKVVDKIAIQLNSDITTKGAIIKTNFKVDSIEYPKIYLESILYNLLSNALKYSRKGIKPIINISTELFENRTMLIIQDNGIGIDLDRFGIHMFKLNKVFHLGYDSKGVGLFITKNQLETQGGKISVESIPGKGSIFSVTF